MSSISNTDSQSDLRKIGLNPSYWYPLAQSKEVKRGKAHGLTFGGEPIVLIRTECNKVFALEDRCAHRQIPLSMGVVCGEQIKCGYHAWQYNNLGKITEIPYLSEGAKLPRYGVKSYPCKEAYEHIWVFPGEAELSEKTTFPNLSIWNNPKYKTIHFLRRADCHYSFHYENLMDMNHQFLHRRFLSNSSKPIPLENSQGSGWVEVKYQFNSEKSNFGANFLTLGKDKTSKMSNSYVVTIRTEYPYQTLELRGANSSVPILNNWVVCVPIDREQKLHHLISILTIRKPKIPGLTSLILPFIRYFTKALFAEDKITIEMEQKAYERQGADWNQEITPAVINLRELLRQKGITLN